MLPHSTPPTCIHVNIYAMAKCLLPNVNVVVLLSSIACIRKLHTTIWEVSKTLACYKLGHAKEWKQLYTDETNCCQTALVNVVSLTKAKHLRPRVAYILSTAIYLKYN